MNHELAKTLTTALVQFIDREQPKDKMCVSSIEAEELERCFMEEKFNGVEDWCTHRMKPELTEFEEELVNFYNKRCMLPSDKDGTFNRHDCDELLHEFAKKLLALAKKELLSYADESNPAIEAMADLERTFSCNPDKLPIWLKDELNKAFKKGQEASHEDYIKGYANGYKDAEKRYQESVAYHYTEPVPPGVVYKAPNNWDDVMVVPNTNSGTSTLKAEG